MVVKQTSLDGKRPPYDYRSQSNAGKYQGMGIPAQVATKDGGFTDVFNPKIRNPKSNPPRKMN